jgi:putative transcriptional regulator
MSTASTDVQDWTRFDAMTDAERHAAALADADARPLTEERLGRMTPTPRVKIIRRALGLSVHEFFARFRIPVELIEDWEARRSSPDQTARAYLMVIASTPDVVRNALD